MENLKKAALLYCERKNYQPLKYDGGEKTFFEHDGRVWLMASDGEAFRLFALSADGEAPEKEAFASMLARVCAGIADQFGPAAGDAVIGCLMDLGVKCAALSAAWHNGAQMVMRVESLGVIGGEE